MSKKETVYVLTIDAPEGIRKVSVKHKVTEEKDDNMKIEIHISMNGDDLYFVAETTEEVLVQLAKSLPVGFSIKSCLSCRYGQFSPVGNYDNELFCVTEFEPKEIGDLWHVTEDEIERKKRSRNLFHLCEHYMPQTSDYCTYSDYRFQVSDR